MKNATRQDIYDEFVEAFDHGTYSDCRIIVEKAKQHGISCAELCDYKRNYVSYSFTE